MRLLAAVFFILTLAGMSQRPKNPGIEEVGACIDQSTGANLSEKTLLQQVKEVVDRSQGISCEKLAIGAHRDVVATSHSSPTSVSHAYRLRRVGEKDFEAELTLEFSQDGISDSKLRELNTKMIERTNACLRTANRALTGPAGETLKVKVAAQSSNPQSDPPKSAVKINPQLKRANSAEWSEALPCTTIVHEVMHLLGLCDEYRESSSGYVRIRNPQTGAEELKRVDDGAEIPLYDCRAKGPDDSLMSAHWTAYAATFPAQSERLYCTSNTCKETLRKQVGIEKINIQALCKKIGCAIGVPRSAWDTHLDSTNEPRNGLIEDSDGFAMITGVELPPKRSLLYPSQLRSILEPGCTSNLNYYLCAAEAYRTSKESDPSGQGCQFTPRRASCQSEDWVTGK